MNSDGTQIAKAELANIDVNRMNDVSRLTLMLCVVVHVASSGVCQMQVGDDATCSTRDIDNVITDCYR